MKTQIQVLLLVTSLLIALPLHAQIVNDGATNTLSNVTTNFTGDVTVGTNGSFTLLVLSDNALLTNSANGLIGRNAGANSNEVRLISAGARWFMGGSLFVGTNGAANRLVVSNGGTVLAGSSGTIGHGGDFSGNANSNTVTVSGAGSLWSNGLDLIVGELGSANRLEVNNGGRVLNGNAFVGRSFFSPSNTVVVTGTGSLWSNRADVSVGGAGSGNLLVVSNGGWVVNSNAYVGNGLSFGNLALVTGINSTWSNRADLYVGNGARGNQLVVSDGALVVDNNGVLGNSVTSSNNIALITGSGSFWTNRTDLTVGFSGRDNQLIVSNGARVVNRVGNLGQQPGSSNNLVVVTGNGSSWTNHLDVNVGVGDRGNRLVIEAGGVVGGDNGRVGAGAFGGSSEALVTGPGSRWSSRTDLAVGLNPANNRLVVSNGAVVVAGNNGRVGVSTPATGNEVLVTGAGSLWSNRFELYVGEGGAGNRMEVNSGGWVVSSNTFLGFNASSSSNVMTVTGPGSFCANVDRLHVGESGSGNLLVVTNGGLIGGVDGSIGENAASSNNTAIITGTNSAWTNLFNFRVGSFGSSNRLIVENGGQIANDAAFIGALGGGNQALVTGAGSRWNTSAELVVGDQSSANRLVVSNGAAVLNIDGHVGYFTVSRSNAAVVTGLGSLWSNATTLAIGHFGGRSLLVVSNGATVAAGDGVTLGVAITSGNNRAVVDGGTLRAANASGNASLNVIRGTNVFNAGLIDVDQLVLTNRTGNVVPATFGNSGLISIPSGLAATPYPSTINVSGLFRSITKVTVTLSNLSHTFPEDIDILLVSPAGQKVMLMSDIGNGAGADITNVRLTFDDAASANLPFVGPIPTGTYRPTDFQPGETMPSPAPGGPYSVTLSSFNGSSPNGTWRLYISDDSNPDSGSLQGWGLQITTEPDQGFFEFNGGLLVTRGAAISNGATFVVGRSGTTPAVWDVHASPGNHVLSENFYVGENSSFNQLLVTNGASLLGDHDGYIGVFTGANSNSALIAGSGSLWTGRGINVGFESAFNRLVISDGAAVFAGANGGVIGGNTGGRSNLAVVTGSGSVWSITNDLIVGGSDVGNQLIVSAGGVAVSGSGVIGFNAGASNNTALITGAGSTWSNSATLVIGRLGARNQLIVSNGAVVFSGGSILVGTNATSTNNRVVVDGATLRVTNVSATGTLDVRRGTTTLTAGLVEVDRLLVTNTLGQFLLNGGTLSTRSTTVASGIFFHVGNNIGPATMFLAGNGTHIFGSSLSIDDNSTLTGNGTIGGVVLALNSGTISPGASIGKMIFTNSPFLLGRVFMEISKNSAALTNDQIQVTTSLTYDGALIVTNLGPTALANGDKFQLFSATSYAGSFSSLTLPPLPPGLSWKNNLLMDGSIEVSAPAAIPISTISSGSYTQNFDSLAMSGANLWRDNSTLLGWYAAKTSAPVQFTSYVAADGSGNSGGLFSFGTTGSSERALGLVPINSLGDIAFGLCFSNDTASSVSNFVITYTGEQWRNGLNANNNTLTFWYQVAPTTITNPEPLVVTNWTQVSNLNFLNPTLLVPETALDGNQPTNRHVFSSILVPGLVVAAGQNIFFRWRDLNDSSADQGMAVDDLIVTFSSLPIERFWTNVLGGNYEIASNWLANAVAGPLDNANFTNNASYQVNWSADALAVNAFFNARSGTVTQAIGGFAWTLTNSYVIGRDSVATAAVTHATGTLRVTNSAGNARLVVGEAGRGVFVLNGGNVQADWLILTNGTKSVLDFNAGTLRAQNSSVTNGTFVDFEVGDGLSSARFELVGTGTHRLGHAVQIRSNALFTGEGTVLNNVVVSGTISPGSPIGQMAIAGILTFDIGSKGIFELNKTAGTYDKVVGLTNIHYEGSLIVTNLAGTLANGDSFKLFGSAARQPSAFTNIVLPALDPGLKWRNKLMMDGSLEVLTIPTRDFGVDVSRFQGAGGVSQASWNQMFAEGKRFVFVRATVGLTEQDVAMANNVTRATAAGILAGVYHHAHPELQPTTNGAVQEADFLLNYAGNFVGPGFLRPVLVLESGTELSTTQLTDWVIAFCDRVVAQRGAAAAPIIYTLQLIANFELDSRLADYDLWIRATGAGPNPGTDDPLGDLNLDPTGVFNEWSFWQYSGNGTAGGISPLDLDVCHSEYKPLASFLIPGPPPTPIQLVGLMTLTNGAFQFNFTNTPGALFSVLATTNVASPLSNWTTLGAVTEISPGQFRFTDSQATNHPQRYYRVRSP